MKNKWPKYLLPVIWALILLPACTPPTPPASPTPWPTNTPAPALSELEPTPQKSPTSTPTLEPAPPPTPSTTTITLWETLPQAQARLLAEEIEAFQEEFSAFAVTQQHYDNPESFMTPLMAGQTNFDLILASPALLGSLWREKQLAPMSDFFPPSFIDGFASITLEGASREKELWGLPDTAGFHLMLFYNRDLVDTPPADTEELLDLAQRLTRASPSGGATSRWGLGVNSYDPLWLVPWLTPYEGWLTDSAGQPTLDTPAMAAALTLHRRWHTGPDSDEALPTGPAPVATYEEMRAQFLQADMAMVIDGEWALAELARIPNLDWGVALLPASLPPEAEEGQPAGPLVLARYWGVSRSATGNRALAAAAFLEYITRPERQLAWTTEFGLLPTRRQALDDPTIVNNAALRVSARQMQAGRVVPLGTNINLILDAMREPLRGVVEGELSPSDAAQMMQEAVSRGQ